MADLNGDKKPDIVVTNYMNGNVGVLLGNGDGTFQPVETYDSGGGPQPWGIAIADINGDDIPDLLVASLGCCISVLSGNGDGTFQPAVLLTQGVWYPNIIAFADVNGDGMLDLVATSQFGGPNGDGVLSVMINAGGSRSATETVLSSSINPSGLNDAITYTATVTNASGGTANGKVAFQDNRFVIASAPVVSGGAVYSTTYTSTGTHSIRATYLGDSSSAGSYADVTERVQPPPFPTSTVLATSGSPSFVGQPVTFTAAVSCGTRTIPDGELVTFYEGLTPLASVALGAGKATYTTSALRAATHYIHASYVGDATFKASSGGVNQIATRYATTTTVTSIPNPSDYGDSVSLTAQVNITSASAPTGWVSFKNGTTALGAALVDATGVATLSKADLPLGSNSITATYNEGLLDALNAKSTSPAIVQTVKQAQITMTLKSWENPTMQGHAVLFTATLTSNGGLPNAQTVGFSYNGNLLGTSTISGGKATLWISTLPVGSDVITATYAGDANCSSAKASVTQIVH